MDRDTEKRKNIEVGQLVWLLRTGGPVQQATVTSIMNCSSSNEEKSFVTVEWEDDSGGTLGKTVSIDDIFPQAGDVKMKARRKACEVRVAGTGEDGSSGQDPGSLPAVCGICALSFKNDRGLKTHIAKKHPAEANNIKIKSVLGGKLLNSQKQSADTTSSLKEEVGRWIERFKHFLKQRESVEYEKLDEAVEEFIAFLREANRYLPGPKHPAVRYYQMRRKNKEKMNSKGAGKVSNPQRAHKAAREKRREQYNYEVAQYNYYNRRRKVVQNVMNADMPKRCPINMKVIEKHFRSTLEQENVSEREMYSGCKEKENLVSIDLKLVHKAIKSTSLDTSPGPDGVVMRTVKSIEVAPIIKCLAELILKNGYVPEPLRRGRTILLYKGKGQLDEVSSWRPITIYPIIRRIIEKVLDYELRQQVTFHSSQRGFVNGLPGCHINARIIDAVLKKAKQEKEECVVAFLDVTGAFDGVGHNHIRRTLEAKGVSPDLANAIMALIGNNGIQISVGIEKSNFIRIKRGVPQGGPLSPTLFNLSIDHLYEEVCDPCFANELGYQLCDGQDSVVLVGFADDQAVTAKNMDSAVRVVNCIQRIFREVGLEINPRKSTAIVVSNGQLRKAPVLLESGEQIMSIDVGEVVKYLGCTFSGELQFNDSSVWKINENMNKLCASSLLKPDQKLNILNQYLFPSMVYPLQAAPLTKLGLVLLESIDVVIRRSVKCMLGIPANSSTSMMYSPRRFRGLGLLRCVWEAPLQHWSIAQRLARVADARFQAIFDYEAEINVCAERLGLEVVNVEETFNVRKVRQALREKAFEDWSKGKWQGVGVSHYKDYPKANRWIYDRRHLSGSEWTNAVKLNINYAPLRGVPGVTGAVGPLCRRCGREPETPAHVLGKCPNNMLLVTRRHHNVKKSLILLLQEKGYQCHEEVYCVDTDGSSRYADIVAFQPNSRKAFLLDPTVRYESDDHLQSQKVDQEKKEIYTKCIPFLKEKFAEAFGERDYAVRGLWFGSRGTIPGLTVSFLGELGIAQHQLADIAEAIIIDSLGILHHHIYG